MNDTKPAISPAAAPVVQPPPNSERDHAARWLHRLLTQLAVELHHAGDDLTALAEQVAAVPCRQHPRYGELATAAVQTLQRLMCAYEITLIGQVARDADVATAVETEAAIHAIRVRG